MVRELEHGSVAIAVPRVDWVVETVVDPVREVVVLLVVKGNRTVELRTTKK